MQTYHMAQGTDEWFDIKRGLASSSHFSTVLSKGSGRKLYMRKLAGERLSGLTESSYSNGNMEAGIELEAAARAYYANINNCTVEQVGFIKRDDDVGSSPDGLVYIDGGLEIKCVIPSTHIETCLRGTMQTCYTPQVQGAMWVSDRKWWDWVSYCPAIKDRPYFCIRIKRDEEYIKELSIRVTMFVTELKEMIAKITQSEF